MFENSKVAVIYVLKSWDYIKGLQKLSIFPIEISLFNPVFECEDIIDGSIVKATSRNISQLHGLVTSEDVEVDSTVCAGLRGQGGRLVLLIFVW